MSFITPRCDRCDARIQPQGDHLCAECANELGRDPRQPFWDNFAALAEERRAA